MTWARFDDSFPQHPKIVGLSDQAFRLHVSAVCYSNANLTDGVIHSSTLPILLPGRPAAGIKRRAEELVAVGAWERADGGCYAIHDFLNYNKTRSEILAKRQQSAEAGAKGGLARSASRLRTPVPVPDPVPTTRSHPDLPPISPPEGDARRAVRAQRAKDGSKRKRDVVAFEDERGEQTLEERYLGKHAGRAS